jgi:3-deoxy-D-manno-octulosonate 8-phosphate phosphatase KdsC-like HAD superfamily phosphatase
MGAVREVCEILLKAQGKWEAGVQKYFPDPAG